MYNLPRPCNSSAPVVTLFQRFNIDGGDSGGKFAASAKHLSHLLPGNHTGGVSRISYVLENFRQKLWKGNIRINRGLEQDDSWKKTWSKNLVTLSL